MRALPALAVVALLVVAGCAAPTSTTTTPDDATESTGSTAADQPASGSSTTSPAASGTTTGGSPATTDADDDASDEDADGDGVPDADALAVNDSQTFRNLTEMLGIDAEQPTLGTRNLSQFFRSETTARQRLLGLEEYVAHPEDDPHGLAAGTDRIYVQPAGASPPIVEQVVVHEQFHTIQFRQGWTVTRRPTTTDGRLAQGGAVEGASVWVAGEYTERYQREGVPRQVQMVRDAVVNGPDGWRVFRAPYYFGARWTEHHLDDPANVSWIYENPPRTTEQLMHNLSADAEPVRPVSVSVQAEGWAGSAGDRLGEAYVWATLRGELPAGAAETAAAGWGGDQIRTVSGPGGETRNLTWAMRWDSARDADEFAAAAANWSAARDANVSIRAVRVNETVTLLLAGDDAFVDAASVSLNGTTVVVTREAAASANQSRAEVPHQRRGVASQVTVRRTLVN